MAAVASPATVIMLRPPSRAKMALPKTAPTPGGHQGAEARGRRPQLLAGVDDLDRRDHREQDEQHRLCAEHLRHERLAAQVRDARPQLRPPAVAGLVLGDRERRQHRDARRRSPSPAAPRRRRRATSSAAGRATAAPAAAGPTAKATEKMTLRSALPARSSSVSGRAAATLARTSARETSAAVPAMAASATTGATWALQQLPFRRRRRTAARTAPAGCGVGRSCRREPSRRGAISAGTNLEQMNRNVVATALPVAS